MASKQDLLEAHGYNRRRLVSAFVSGAPQGRDVESVRRGRPVVAGLAVSALLLGGSALAGVLTSAPDGSWADGHVVIGRQSAARFVTAKNVLYPVLNATSARLMLPASAGFPVVVMDDKDLATTPRGPVRGILGAPDDLPVPDALVQTRWVSCLAGSRTRTTLTTRELPDPDPTTPTALFVTSGQTRWLVANGHRFALPDERLDTNLRVQIGRGRTDPLEVPGTWLDLLRLGGTLTVSVPNKGGPLTGSMSAGGKVTQVGRMVGVPDGSGQTAYSLVFDDGLVPLSPFAAMVYRAQEPELSQTKALVPADLAGLPISPRARAAYPDTWPVAVPTPVPAGTVPCAVLDTYAAADRTPTTRLASVPPDSASAPSAAGPSVVVDPSHGALVRASSTAGPGGPVFLVDQSGQKFAITDPSDETLARLGYAGVSPRVVPGPWVLLFPSGPALSEAAALGSPLAPAPSGAGP